MIKNKHLVLIFLLVLFLGYIGRRVPWRCRSEVRSCLIHTPEDVYRIRISRLGRPDLLLERTSTGWAAEQEGRVVPLSGDTMTALLQQLGRSVTFSPLPYKKAEWEATEKESRLYVQFHLKNRSSLSIEIGPQEQTAEGCWTRIYFPQHKGLYRVQGAFRSLFDRSLNDFRSRLLLPFELEHACAITLSRPPDSIILWTRTDTSEWKMVTDTAGSSRYVSLHYWLNAVAQLKNLPFADFFDESREEQWLQFTAHISACDGRSFALRFFVLEPPDVPEDIHLLIRQGIRVLPRYVVHSSANPRQYFLIPDAEIGARLCSGP
ncbi:MAG: DUF4340 domain-containing protein [Saprospiraceae bacterium]|nr:DUF4340 domain-containing protein [Saprospiraceae bacterium]MDW8483125.1 hypothetical protein [Saprospiraceae bacterium]